MRTISALLVLFAPSAAHAAFFGEPDWENDPGIDHGSTFGMTVSIVGDVDGDGYADVAVGAPMEGSFFEGTVYFYLGGAGGPSDTADWSTNDFSESATGGYALGGADFDGDGLADLLVGAPNEIGSVDWEGRVRLYLGTDAGPEDDASWIAEPADQSAAQFGSQLAVGDIDADGHPDLAVAAFSWSGEAEGEGKVFVYRGGPDGLEDDPSWSSDPTDEAGAGFGTDVDVGGDVNGDGYGDLVVTAYGVDDVEEDEGRIYLYRGGPDGLEADPSWSASPTHENGSSFGFSVSFAGDVNGDGYDDIVVGAGLADGDVVDEGCAYLFLGGPDGPSAAPVWAADPTDEFFSVFGSTVTDLGDVDGDGYDDVAIAADNGDDEAPDEGLVYVYRGNATGLEDEPAETLDPTDAVEATFGEALATGGDVNGDGVADLLVGAPYWSGDFVWEGKAYFFEGNPCVIRGEGESCSDGDPCNGDEVCGGGACVEGTPLECDDGDACTEDSCEEGVGCVNAPCDDGVDCTVDECDPVLGCSHVLDDGLCEDGDPCTDDTCHADIGCSHPPMLCDDGNPCTYDECDPETGCETAPSPGAACDDGDPCTKGDACDEAGICGGTPDDTCDDPGSGDGGSDADADADAGPEADDPSSRRKDAGGCGCRTPSGSASPAALALLFALFLRRRRARPS